jgi:hypothetical protein
MSKQNFPLIDLDENLIESAVRATLGHDRSNEEFELAFEDAALENPPPEFDLLVRRAAQGLALYPDEPKEVFFKVDENGEVIEWDKLHVVRQASQWFVRQEMRFFDIDRLDNPMSKFDVIQVLAHRIKMEFPGFELTPELYKSMLDTLLNSPTADPTMTVPVWSGRSVSKPGNSERRFFESGVATINTWKRPEYRVHASVEPTLGMLGEFLAYIMPNVSERDVFLDWLAWCLQNEDDKPSWAIFLFSEKHGTGKSALAQVVKQLFGAANTSEQQGIKPLISRFNRPVLSKKFVYAEEVKVAPNSDDGNKLKTLISERFTMSEAKGRDIAPIEHRCCFLFTTNHKPIWLEPGDRRFYIIKIDHKGFNSGGEEYEKFVELVTKMKAAYKSKQNLADLYQALMNRQLAKIFDPYSLNVNLLSTEVMAEISLLSSDIVEELLAEFIREQKLCFIPVRYSQKLIEHFAKRNPNASKYTFDRLGWKKGKFAWGGKPAAWVFYDPACLPSRGMLLAPSGKMSIEEQINGPLALALNDIGFGIAHEYVDPGCMTRDQDDFY